MANISKINNYDIKDATARAAIDTINHSSNGVLAQAKKYADDKVAAHKDADTVDGVHIVKLTKAEYDALGTKDSNTLYLVTE